MTRPVGIVTFLFTDIEGSTRLWDRHPEAMRRALARHDALLREAIERHEGYVFKTMGDAFCAAFSSAVRALEAALDLQRALQESEWPEEIGAPRVRVALHTGEPEARDDDYFGPPLNRVARILSAGHGEQILLSRATRDLLLGALPEHTSFRDMGQHRLKDLLVPEHLYQVLAPGLPADLPPLRSLDSLPNNLPQQLTSFIGREREMAAVKEALASSRLVTLAGAGGSGKTRLALQVAADLLDAYPDGVWLVELASLSDPSLVPQAVASALGVREEAGRSLTQTLADYLKPRTLLLLVDNCEHLVDACARLLHTLLSACPDLRVMATSREVLRVAGETVWRVPTLTPPDPERLPPPANLEEYDSVRLFRERASTVQPGFAITSGNARAVAQLCHRLDGMPLAIELAAARTRVLSPEQIADRLDDRFRLLTGGSRTALPRQQTLRALIDWSYELLGEPERALLRRLAVFAGGWTLEAAEAVCKDEGGRSSGKDEGGRMKDEMGKPSSSFIPYPSSFIEEWQILDLMTDLADKSLVIAEEREAGPRYRLLETVRQYALDRLNALDDAAAVRGRHADWTIAFARQALKGVAGPEQMVWLDRLEAEHDNVRAALQWCAKDPDGGEKGLRLSASLWRFWDTRGYLSEGRQHYVTALAHPGAAGAIAARADALHGAAILVRRQGDYAAARPMLEEALAIRRALNDRGGIALVLNLLGDVDATEGDYAAARADFEESLAIRRELGYRPGIAATLLNLGNLVHDQQDYAGALALYSESLEIYRELGDSANTAIALTNIGNVAMNQSRYAEARPYYEESLAIARSLDDRWGIALVLVNLGRLLCYLGELDAAGAALAECLTRCRQMGLRRLIAFALEGYGLLARLEGRPDRAVRLLAAAAALREEIRNPLARPEQEEFDRDVALSRTPLGEPAFARAWAEGRAMSLEQAMDLALDG